MRLNIIIFILFLFTIINLAAQDDPISRLYSKDDSDVMHALSDIQKMKLTEAIPVIHELIESKYFIPFIQLEMVITLHLLGDEDFLLYANKLIVNSSSFDQAESPIDPKQAKAVTYLLMYLHEGNDEGYFYKGYQYFIENYKAPYFSFFLSALEKALGSPHEQLAKNTLINIVQNHSDYYFRIEVLVILYSKYGVNINLVFEETFLNDLNPNVRFNAIRFLIKNISSQTKNFIIENILNEAESTIKYQGARYVLEKFGEPRDLNLVTNLKNIETDELYLGLYNSDVKRFIPPPFNPDLTVLEVGAIIDSHIEDIISYNWAPKEYIEYFNLIQRFLADPSQYNKAVDEINSFLLQVEKDYADEVITLEAYKFLKQEPEYLLEKLKRE